MPKKKLENYLSLPFFKPLSIILLINLLLILLILLIRNNLPPQVPLYYGRPFGAEQLADKYSLIIPPLFSMFVIFINIALIQLLKDNFLRYVLFTMTIVTTCLSAITVLKIIFIVGSF
jgi:hypothetical protein